MNSGFAGKRWLTNFHSLWTEEEILEENFSIGFRPRYIIFWSNLDKNLHFSAILEIKSGVGIMSPEAHFLNLIWYSLRFSSRDRAGIMMSITNVKKLSKTFNDFPRLHIASSQYSKILRSLERFEQFPWNSELAVLVTRALHVQWRRQPN